MPRRDAVQRRLSGRGVRDRGARDTRGGAQGAAAGSAGPSSLPSTERRPRHERRYIDAAHKGVLRSANIMPAPVIEIVLDPRADPKEVDKRVNELRGLGHTVVLTTPEIPLELTPVGEPNPLTDHGEVASATVRDDAVTLVVHSEPNAQERAALVELGRAVARHHGSATTNVEIAVSRRP